MPTVSSSSLLKVGFYSHVDAEFHDDGSASVPAHLGIFIRELADQTGGVVSFLHNESAGGHLDFLLEQPHVRCVDLGPRRSFPARTFRPTRTLKHFDPKAEGIDVMLILGPSPLLPHLARLSRKVIPVAVLLWGDYGDRLRQPSHSWWRHWLIELWVRYYAVQQRRAARGALVLVQNPNLARGIRGARAVEIAAPSSLPEAAIEDRGPDVASPLGRPIRVLYTGRIMKEKGLFEAVEALALLQKAGLDVTLEVVGWDDPSEPTSDRLVTRARELGVSDLLLMSGYRAAGPELARVYRSADVYLFPSHWDSFPRSMQEAMAMGLPVIATRVGGIAAVLDGSDAAVLVEPRSARALADAVRSMAEDDELRTRTAKSGRSFARNFTVEHSTRVIVGHLSDLVGNSA